MKGFLIALALFFVRPAYADTIHFKSGARIQSGTFERDLPPGYYLTEDVWTKLDTEVKRLQTAETRLTAENKSLRNSNQLRPARTIMWIVGAVAFGFAAGATYVAVR